MQLSFTSSKFSHLLISWDTLTKFPFASNVFNGSVKLHVALYPLTSIIFKDSNLPIIFGITEFSGILTELLDICFISFKSLTVTSVISFLFSLATNSNNQVCPSNSSTNCSLSNIFVSSVISSLLFT